MKSNLIGTVALAGIAIPLMTAASAQETAQSFCGSGYVAADENADGILEAAEIEALRAAEFGALDENADGTVTRDEFTVCTGMTGASEVLPRNVGAESGGLPPVEMPALEDGSLTRTEFMEAAELAFDATRNEEENPIEWARNFILLTPGEDESGIAEMSRQEFAARSVALFFRLDVDGNDQLSTEEWQQTETPAAPSMTFGAAFDRADADQSDDLTSEEYMAAGTAQAERGRLAALARGWGNEGTQAGGVESTDEPAEGVSAQGLVATDSPASMVESRVPVFDYYFDRGE